jgi:enolase
MRTIRAKATVTFKVDINQMIEVSEEDNRISIAKKMSELAKEEFAEPVKNEKVQIIVDDLYLSDVDGEGNPLLWVRP